MIVNGIRWHHANDVLCRLDMELIGTSILFHMYSVSHKMHIHIICCDLCCWCHIFHYNDVIMSALVSQITSITIVYSTVYSRRISKKISKLRVTGLCAGNSPVTGEFPAQRDSNAENVSVWLRHHGSWAIDASNKELLHKQNTLQFPIASVPLIVPRDVGKNPIQHNKSQTMCAFQAILV